MLQSWKGLDGGQCQMKTFNIMCTSCETMKGTWSCTIKVKWMRIWNDFLQFTTTDGIRLEYASKVSKVTYNFAYIMCRSCAKIETQAHTGCTILCTSSLRPQTPFLAANVACEKIEVIKHWTSIIQNILVIKTYGNRGSHGKLGWATANIRWLFG